MVEHPVFYKIATFLESMNVNQALIIFLIMDGLFVLGEILITLLMSQQCTREVMLGHEAGGGGHSNNHVHGGKNITTHFGNTNGTLTNTTISEAHERSAAEAHHRKNMMI